VHNSDVSGVILDSDEEWTHFCIPMVFDEKQVRRCVTVALPQYDTDEPWQDEREDGDLMWPERFGIKEIEGLRRLGDWFWSGRYQQSPVPAGGGIIKRDFWQPWDNVEAQRYGLEWTGARREFPDIELVVASLDTAYGEKEENDYNALTVWGIWIDFAKNRRAMLMFAWAKRLPLHSREVFAYPNESKADYEARKKENWGLVEWVADTCKRYKVRRLLIEDKTRGRDVANELKRLYARDNWGIELLVPTKDKVTRVLCQCFGARLAPMATRELGAQLVAPSLPSRHAARIALMPGRNRVSICVVSCVIPAGYGRAKMASAGMGNYGSVGPRHVVVAAKASIPPARWWLVVRQELGAMTEVGGGTDVTGHCFVGSPLPRHTCVAQVCPRTEEDTWGDTPVPPCWVGATVSAQPALLRRYHVRRDMPSASHGLVRDRELARYSARGWRLRWRRLCWALRAVVAVQRRQNIMLVADGAAALTKLHAVTPSRRGPRCTSWGPRPSLRSRSSVSLLIRRSWRHSESSITLSSSSIWNGRIAGVAMVVSVMGAKLQWSRAPP
jgi:hypothetical protein